MKTKRMENIQNKIRNINQQLIVDSENNQLKVDKVILTKFITF
jgi:hypothetical protein